MLHSWLPPAIGALWGSSASWSLIEISLNLFLASILLSPCYDSSATFSQSPAACTLISHMRTVHACGATAVRAFLVQNATASSRVPPAGVHANRCPTRRAAQIQCEDSLLCVRTPPREWMKATKSRDVPRHKSQHHAKSQEITGLRAVQWQTS